MDDKFRVLGKDEGLTFYTIGQRKDIWSGFQKKTKPRFALNGPVKIANEN